MSVLFKLTQGVYLYVEFLFGARILPNADEPEKHHWQNQPALSHESAASVVEKILLGVECCR